MKIAIIGAGISGLGAAHALLDHCDVDVFEKAPRAGGHAHTVQIEHTGKTIDVDIGFIVYNDRNYPRLIRLFDDLGVETEPSDMSFSVHTAEGDMEWGGSPKALFAQKRNLMRPRFIRMLNDILRFNKNATADLERPQTLYGKSLGDYLIEGGYGVGFQEDYLLPMAAAIWSCPIDDMPQFPAYNFLSFYHNHGLLTLNNRPKWRTVSGGSQNYVSRITEKLGTRLHLGVGDLKIKRAGLISHLSSGSQEYGPYDHVIVATHGDQVLPLLSDPDQQERDAFSLFRTSPNTGYLHRSEALMPHRRSVWASWNYRKEQSTTNDPVVCLTYWMNNLQNLDPSRDIFLTLNPQTPPPEAQTFATFNYAHPIYDDNTPEAYKRVQSLQGHRNTWYAGAYLGHGFHEDGLRAGELAAEGILATLQVGSPSVTAAE